MFYRSAIANLLRTSRLSTNDEKFIKARKISTILWIKLQL